MSYKVRGFVDDKLLIDGQMDHIPRVGETVRYGAPDQYAEVTEVIWCLNEQSLLGQRVNIRMETI